MALKSLGPGTGKPVAPKLIAEPAILKVWCAKCGREIADNEQPHLLGDTVTCEQCYARANPPAPSSPALLPLRPEAVERMAAKQSIENAPLFRFRWSEAFGFGFFAAFGFMAASGLASLICYLAYQFMHMNSH